MKELEDFLKSKINEDFDFDEEHWENGNFDDSHSYGIECGEQYAYLEILNYLKKMGH